MSDENKAVNFLDRCLVNGGWHIYKCEAVMPDLTVVMTCSCGSVRRSYPNPTEEIVTDIDSTNAQTHANTPITR